MTNKKFKVKYFQPHRLNQEAEAAKKDKLNLEKEKI